MVVQDFRSPKKIIEFSDWADWNRLLPGGLHLIQDSETIFGTHYQVAEWSLKALYHVSTRVKRHLEVSATIGCNSLKKTSNLNGTITGYPFIEAIFDGFSVVVDCIERFKVYPPPKMHIALPWFFKWSKN